MAKKHNPLYERNEISIIQQTDVDAKIAKRSAAAIGYLNDPFIPEFVTLYDRKSPIINRGTYVRTRAIDHLIWAVVLANPETTIQIVSLGAGTDTRFFNLQSQIGGSRSIRYHEFDFREVTGAKAKVILQSPRLQSLVHADSSLISIDVESGSVISPTYCLHPKDVRDLPQESSLPRYLDTNLPTIFISECCLIYMDQEHASSVLRWITDKFQNGIGLILYEPIGGDDAFGRMMIRNLAARGINLKTLSAHPTLDAQIRRLKDCGFSSGQDAIDVNFAHDNWMGRSELQRISKLEMLDELEEWRLLASHYCIAWGWKTGLNESEPGIFGEWSKVKSTCE